MPELARDQALIDRLDDALGPLIRAWFRPTVRGWERLPPAPCMLVGNHSALGFAEVACILSAWNSRFGAARPIYGLAHDAVFHVPKVRELFGKGGGLRASRENALAALGAGHDVLVYPGGDLDATRPFYEPRAVHFGARRGYARVAHEAGVPIVPLATIGSHYTLPMLPGGALVARAFGLGRLRIERAPLPATWAAAALSAALTAAGVLDPFLGGALVMGGLTLVPARVTTEILEPVITSGDADEVHERVHGALSRAVATMRH